MAEKQTISAQIPKSLTLEVEKLAMEMDRSKSWIIKEALNLYINVQKQQRQQVLAGLADVDAGRVVSHDDVLNGLIKRG